MLLHTIKLITIHAAAPARQSNCVAAVHLCAGRRHLLEGLENVESKMVQLLLDDRNAHPEY